MPAGIVAGGPIAISHIRERIGDCRERDQVPFGTHADLDVGAGVRHSGVNEPRSEKRAPGPCIAF